jgi:D-alanyl-D-alanine carboxypeptidase/D-alanyl-D-alanine-endopeptidase (penicillin-binding protein 4)
VFADLLRTALLRRGLVDSSVVIGIGSMTAPLVELGAIVRPLDEVLAEMNKQSDNLCAEMTLRLLGTSLPGGAASAKSGLEAMHTAFRDKGLPTGPLALVDGSGISFYNLVGVGFLGKVLRLMAVQEQFDRYRSALAVPGGEGTMRNRLQGEKHVAGVRMKTGTLRGVSTLAGYVQAPGGRLLSVVLFMQNFTGSHTPFREAQDRMVRHCLEYSASPQNATRPR